jgi:hypothetical protein
LFARAWRKSKPPAHVDSSYDLAAQVDQALDDARGLGHGSHLLGTQYFLHMEHVHSKKEVRHKEG